MTAAAGLRADALWVLLVVDLPPRSVSGGEGGDLDQVVGEDPLSGPGFGSFEAVQAAAVPVVSAFDGADPAFASGSPFDGSAKRPAVFDLLPVRAGSALAGVPLRGIWVSPPIVETSP